MLVRRFSYCRRQVLQVAQRGARVLLSSDLAAIRAGMARNQPLPVHRNQLFEPILDVRQVLSAMPRNGTVSSAIQSTVKMIFSFGSRITRVLSEWFLPR